MLYEFGRGLLAGMGMSLMLGTVFFSLVQNSIERGWNKGVMIAAGVVISDMIFITLAVLGVQFIDAERGNIWIHSAAIVLLLALGINMLKNKRSQILYPESRLGKALYFFSNGFLLNILNPVNFLFWAGWAAVARTEWAYETPQLINFFSGCLLSIFGMEVLISFTAHRIRPYLKTGVLDWINRITGMLFIGIALYLVYDLIRNYS